ncbi:MAG: haloalkane dehalogenase, partial [Mesorhizobium sp.]
NCRLIDLGPGAHYLQEDHADRIGAAIAGWIPEIAFESHAAEPA